MRDSHCADAVLSLANRATIVGEVAATLIDLAAYWVQTLSDYNVLMAKVVDRDWAAKHMPVLSRRNHDPTRYTTFFAGIEKTPTTPEPCRDDHILFTRFSFGQPGGKLPMCHRRCDQPISVKETATKVRLDCDKCKSRGFIPQYHTRGRSLVAVKFPQDQFPVEWKDRKQDASLAPPDKIVRSSSMPPMKTNPPIPPTPEPTISPMSEPTISPMPELMISPPPEPMVSPMPKPIASPTPELSERLFIRISRPKSTPNLTQSGGVRSTGTTPSPSSPQELPRPPKRSIAELKSSFPRRVKSKDDTS